MDTNLTGRSIVLGVSGSIAAYKAADIASQLGHMDAHVHAVMTPHAAEFIGPATLRALTRNPVLVGLFDEPEDSRIAHIQLAQQSDLILVAPATANILAKMAHGIADDLLSSLLLAATVPVLVAPAMNSAMLEHPATQANIATLRSRGVEFVDPAFGMLACQYEGRGKLADVPTILSRVVAVLNRRSDMAGVRVLVTAGATREPIDPVRFISNRSSGKMGIAIAEAARDRGAEVTLVLGSSAIPPPPGVTVVRIGTTQEMLAAVQAEFKACDLLIAAAAPADYAPAQVAERKIKKQAGGAALSLELHQTPDILATLAPCKEQQFVIGFAAETNDVLEHAREKMVRKALDLIVANDVTAHGAGFEVDTNVVTLLRPNKPAEPLRQMPKRAVADRILDAYLAARVTPQ